MTLVERAKKDAAEIPMDPLIENSDKFFWHGYHAFYEQHFPVDIAGNILEMGVLHGNSVRYLLTRFPSAQHITGVDIVSQRETWPNDAKVDYVQLDQGDEREVGQFFQRNQEFDLIIEDGSHVPSHQERCFRLGFDSLNSGGIYVVEDIHTSLPTHELFLAEQASSVAAYKSTPNLLTLLLVFEKYKRNRRHSLSEYDYNYLARNPDFDETRVTNWFACIRDVHIYKRANFPERCWKCGSEEFDYARYECVCGAEIYKCDDSMTILVKKK